MRLSMEWLNYHHLRYFWAVAKDGGLAKAAARLRVSQPSISGQIRELEEALGERLFRRAGRRNVLTDPGQMVFRYADEIFSLGEELMNAVRRQPSARAIRLHVGITDSLPKLVTERLLRPVFAMAQPVHVVCREGRMDELLAQLAMHRLDVVLADEPASTSPGFRLFDQVLGESDLSVCAAPGLAARLRRRPFPAALDGAPALLPAEMTVVRRAVELWFREQGVRPRVIGEFDDLALMKVMAAGGLGFVVVPTVAANEAARYHGLRCIGRARECRVQFHAITAERRILHPAAQVITSVRSRSTWAAASTPEVAPAPAKTRGAGRRRR